MTIDKNQTIDAIKSFLRNTDNIDPVKFFYVSKDYLKQTKPYLFYKTGNQSEDILSIKSSSTGSTALIDIQSVREEDGKFLFNFSTIKNYDQNKFPGKERETFIGTGVATGNFLESKSMVFECSNDAGQKFNITFFGRLTAKERLENDLKPQLTR